jgi:hypothetical protein
MAVDYSLYLVADADYAAGRDLAALVRAAVAGGVTVVQLRAKGLAGRALVELGYELRRALAATGVPLLVNDRVDVAIACGAAGVHLGQEDMPVRLARALLGPDGAGRGGGELSVLQQTMHPDEPPEIPPALGPKAPGVLDNRVQVAAVDLDGDDVEALLEHGLGDGHAVRQIGRASCRERV